MLDVLLKNKSQLSQLEVEMVYDIIMWFYASMALFVGALLWIFNTREKPPVFPPEWICDGCGQVCSELKEGFCEYCDKQLAK